MHILASGPELQAVRFGYAILDENVKKRADDMKVSQSRKCQELSKFLQMQLQNHQAL